jgi:hypothetical protein
LVLEHFAEKMNRKFVGAVEKEVVLYGLDYFLNEEDFPQSDMVVESR